MHQYAADKWQGALQITSYYWMWKVKGHVWFDPLWSAVVTTGIWSSALRLQGMFFAWFSTLTNDRYPKQSPAGPFNLQTPNVSYSWRTARLTSKVAFYILFQEIQVPNILNMVYILRFFFSSKCSLFRNSNVFGTCIIHILYTECAKIKKIIPPPNG